MLGERLLIINIIKKDEDRKRNQFIILRQTPDIIYNKTERYNKTVTQHTKINS